MIIWLDTETYSACDLAKCGAHRYAEDATTEVTLFGYAIGDAPAKVWDRTATKVPPADLLEACARTDAVFIAHNSAFDRAVLSAKVSPTFEDVSRWQDTLIKAYSVSLPGSLGALSEVLGLPQDKAKDKDGRRLVLKFCKPTPAGVRRTRETDPEDWARFVEYCRLDVEAMRETAKRIPAWNMTPAAWDDWRIDQRINDRGICLDSDLIAAAVSAAERAKAAGNDKVAELTDGAVRTTGQRDELLRFILDAYGATLPDMRKSTLERCLDDDALPEGVRELIALRLQSAKASVQKFLALDRAKCADGRLRGTMQYMGASRTGRWAGRIFQPQNLPRGTMKPAQVETAIRALKSGAVEYLYDDVNDVISNCIRGAVVAPKGKKLVVADLSNIEGRVLAWLAGEEWKLEAFRAYDRGEGPDIYKATYGRTFGIDPKDVTKAQRQIGKVLELALGYEGGVGAFITFAVPYRVNLDDLADLTFRNLDRRYIDKASSFWDFACEKKITHGLKRDTFIACDAIKRAWRDSHPRIVDLWRGLGESAVAIASGASKRVGINERVRMVSPYRGWMTTVLPSGRGVCYPGVKLSDDGHDDAVTYLGVNQRTRKWGPLKTYAGKLCIAKDTRVLTDCGWTPIQLVTRYNKVWDGEEWVSQDGAVFQGEKAVVYAYGAYMTPDHKVLTVEGWKDASEGYDRADCRLPDGYQPSWERSWAGRLAMPMLRLRGYLYRRWAGLREVSKEGCRGVMRLPSAAIYCGAKNDARNVEAPGFCGVAVHVGSLPIADASGVEKLRRAWHSGLRSVERVFRELLGGHGAGVPTGSDSGSDRQRRELLPGELPVGDVQRASREQSPEARLYRWGAPIVLGREDWDRTDDTTLQTGARLPAGAPIRQAGRRSEVFDLRNCGPRHRFVIETDEGPLIVHNCENLTQSAARDVLMRGIANAEAAGYRVVMHVHDEIIAEAPDSPEFSAEGLAACMTDMPAWADGLPLAAAGFEAYRYRKD